eukprot:IDg1276t1
MDFFNGIEHRINLKTGYIPVCAPRRALSISVASHNVFVPKKDRGIRVTTDFRALKSRTIADSYPMENMRVILDWLASKTIFSIFGGEERVRDISSNLQRNTQRTQERTHNARLKLSKCSFGVRRVEMLGHVVDQDRFHPSEKHVQAIGRLVYPASWDELMRFLGLVNYFSDFADYFSDTAKLLYAVLV